jgi:hypothetical protein
MNISRYRRYWREKRGVKKPSDSNPHFSLTRVNAIRALSRPQGAIIEVAGPGGKGADIVFHIGVQVLRRELKCIIGEAIGTFSREISHAAE